MGEDMENKKSKNTIIILLIIIIVGLIGFIMYDKVLNNDNEKTTNQTENIENSNTNQDNKVEQTSNSYELFKDNLIKERTEKYDTSNDKYIVDRKSYCTPSNINYTISLSSNGELELVILGQKETNEKIIAKNVLLYELADIGQGGMKSLYFIKEDGTVSSYFVENYIVNNEDEKVEDNIGNFKNVIAIIPGTVTSKNEMSGAMSPNFIDINGNILSLNY